jgi:phage terminase large subunit
MGLPLWTPASQLKLYDTIGYGQTLRRPDGSVWEMPAEQKRFLLNWEDRYHVVICPARASKSYSAAKKVLPLILGREPKADGTGPRPTRGWIVGPTYELAEKEFRYIWDDLMVQLPKLGMPRPLLARDSKKGGDLYLLTSWGAEVVGKSADKPQSLLGEALDWVLLSEAAQLPSEIWTRFLEPRLSTTRGYALFPTTPDAGALWLHDLYVKGLDGTKNVASYTWDVFGNPVYPAEELEEKRAFYGEDSPIFREQYLGQWTFYHGVVYGADFDPARNLMDARDIPKEWRRIRAIDFGYRDPFVCLWFAITPDSELWLYREYYHPGRSMAHHAQAIRELSKDEQILYTVADSSEPQSIADLRRLGVPAIEAKRDRRAGRMLVGDYLRDGRLRFVRGQCPQTIREINFYRWDVDKNKEGAKEATVGDDHAMDAMRYAIMSRPTPAQARVLKPSNTFEATMARRKRQRLAEQWPLMVGR